MKKLIILKPIVVFFIMACQSSQKEPTSHAVGHETYLSFQSPESIVAYNSGYLVSNVGKELLPMTEDGDGFILECDSTGKPILNWSENVVLNAPKGMTILNNILYVTDIDRIVGIGLKSKKVVLEIDLSTTKGKFFNDIAVQNNHLLVSATDISKVFKINPVTHHFEALDFDQELLGPNGINVVDENTLMIVEWGSDSPNGRILKAIKNEDGVYNIHVLSQLNGNLDGVQIHENTLLVSDWATGSIYGLDLMSNEIQQHDSTLQGPADFLLTKNGAIVVPQMMVSKVSFY